MKYFDFSIQGVPYILENIFNQLCISLLYVCTLKPFLSFTSCTSLSGSLYLLPTSSTDAATYILLRR